MLDFRDIPSQNSKVLRTQSLRHSLSASARGRATDIGRNSLSSLQFFTLACHTVSCDSVCF